MAIHLHIGPMFAGKTTDALRTARSLAAHPDHRVVWVHNGLDTRCADPPALAYTHGGHQRIECQTIVAHAPACAPPDLAKLQLPPGTTHVILDEAQFYTADDIRQVVAAEWALALGLQVHAYALLTDATSTMWNATRALLEQATYVTHHFARCEYCSADAPKNALRRGRLREGEVVIGGAAEYVALCAACYSKHTKPS